MRQGMRFAVVLVLSLMAVENKLFAETGSGSLVVIKTMDVVEPAKPIPLSIANADGVKIAFQTTGNDLQTKFTLHEASLGDGPFSRDAYRFTGSGASGYAWGGGDWTPCLYRADQFLPQDDSGAIHEGVPRKSSLANFTKLTFHATKNQIRNLVIYRGDDTTPPEAPGQLAAQAGSDGVHLTWKAASDNVGVAWYVISRAEGSAKFTKIAQTANLEFTDKPPAAGTFRYRVLAADYERNVGTWSAVVTVNAQGFAPAAPNSVATDALNYAEHIRAVHDAGAGKVVRGYVYNYGDCYNYLDRTQDRNRAILPLIPYTTFNSIRNPNQDLSPVTTSATLLKDIDKYLTLRPEFCVLTCGIEDLRATPPPEPKVVVDNVLQIIKKFEALGTVVIFTTTVPYGKANPIGSPEEALNDALTKMCESNKVPVARVFDMFRDVAKSGGDFSKLMSAVDKDTHGGAWPKGFGYSALWPSLGSLEKGEGHTRRLIVVKETLERVLFTLLYRAE